jgi:hypothetical protein
MDRVACHHHQERSLARRDRTVCTTSATEQQVARADFGKRVPRASCWHIADDRQLLPVKTLHCITGVLKKQSDATWFRSSMSRVDTWKRCRSPFQDGIKALPMECKCNLLLNLHKCA